MPDDEDYDYEVQIHELKGDAIPDDARRSIWVKPAVSGPLSVKQARRLAQELITTADEIEFEQMDEGY